MMMMMMMAMNHLFLAKASIPWVLDFHRLGFQTQGSDSGVKKSLSAVQSPQGTRLPHLELLCGRLDGSFDAGGRLRPERGNVLVDEFRS